MKTLYFRQTVAVLAALGGTALLQAASTVQFTATSYSVTEDAGAVTLNVQRLDDTNSVVSVDYATTNGTATAGLKYTAVSGTLAFTAGVTNQAISVPVLNEPFVEGTRSFQVILSNPTGEAVLGGRTTATVQIKDNDTGLQIEYGSYRVGEAAGPVVIGVVRGDDGGFPVTVEYATTDGTASAGQDYAATVGTLTFAVGERLKLLAIPIINDALKEPTETFSLTLSNPSSGMVLGAKATATIVVLDMTGMEAHRFDGIAVLPNRSVQLTLGGGVHKRFKDYFDLCPTDAGFRDRVRDLRFILDMLDEWNETDAAFAGRLDVTSVATMGWSWGGGVAGEVARIDGRCKAAVVIEGYFQNASDLLRLGLDKPSLSIYAAPITLPGNELQLFNKATHDAVWFQVTSIVHSEFLADYWYSGSSRLPSLREAMRTMSAYSFWFLNKYLRGSTDPMPALADYPRVINFKQK